jgi:fatty-acyl-CoA synthase
VPRPGRNPSRADILAYMEGKIARWWLPDDVAFIDEIPHTATGKIQKAALRQRFAGHVFAS